MDQEEEKSNLYELIGGADKLRELVDRFYDLMQLEPEFAGINAMHPQPNDSSRDKLFWFCLAGWAAPICISNSLVIPVCGRVICITRLACLNVINGCAAWLGLCKMQIETSLQRASDALVYADRGLDA